MTLLSGFRNFENDKISNLAIGVLDLVGIVAGWSLVQYRQNLSWQEFGMAV
jgi:hypothetical protein